MLIDARQIPSGSIIEADLCIIGAGAAGMTIACELAGGPQSVCLLESGGLDFEDSTQALYQGMLTGHAMNALDISRLRYFGGTTNHWGGMCAPLADDDFHIRPWIQFSGWPINRTDLEPFYRRASPYVQIASANFDPAAWADEVPALFTNKNLRAQLEPVLFQLSPPTRFGEVYRDTLANSSHIRALLYANLLAFDTDQEGRRVEQARVATLEGQKFTVLASNYILAAGAIENARLLLTSNHIQKAGLGNQFDLVGRFFMGHPQLDNVARIHLWSPSSSAAKSLSATLHTYVMMQLASAVTGREQIAQFGAHVDPLASETASSLHHTPAYLALKRLVARAKGTSFPNKTPLDDVSTVLNDVSGLVRGLYTRFGRAPILDIRPQCEQVPNPNSRVTLSSERDALGLAKVDVKWQLSDLDVVSIRRGLTIVGETFNRAGLGKIEITDALRETTPQTIDCNEAWHHLGTTRMSNDPRAGVVDQNCCVHGINNLYIAGSSVFPTTGIVNPTYTIVALAVRLADHIRGQNA